VSRAKIFSRVVCVVEEEEEEEETFICNRPYDP